MPSSKQTRNPVLTSRRGVVMQHRVENLERSARHHPDLNTTLFKLPKRHVPEMYCYSFPATVYRIPLHYLFLEQASSTKDKKLRKLHRKYDTNQRLKIWKKPRPSPRIRQFLRFGSLLRACAMRARTLKTVTIPCVQSMRVDKLP